MDGKETTLYTFEGSYDGAYPDASLIKSGGLLYGTAQAGGAFQEGTVFSVTPKGDYKVVYSFGGVGGPNTPTGGLLNIGGTFYGVGYAGAEDDNGGVYSITPDGVENVVYSFFGGSDGSIPGYVNLTHIGRTLFGTTIQGGPAGTGTVFKVTTSGSDEKILHAFDKVGAGLYPMSGLIVVDHYLYGTTQLGGDTKNCATYGCGTVFRIKP
jgi:uncharacterized repeat protein (TIGR03803 family)